MDALSAPRHIDDAYRMVDVSRPVTRSQFIPISGVSYLEMSLLYMQLPLFHPDLANSTITDAPPLSCASIFGGALKLSLTGRLTKPSPREIAPPLSPEETGTSALVYAIHSRISILTSMSQIVFSFWFAARGSLTGCISSAIKHVSHRQNRVLGECNTGSLASATIAFTLALS